MVEFVGLILELPGRGRVHSDSLGAFRRALGVVGFIRVRWVHSRAWEPLGLFGIVWFILARPGGPRVHSGTPNG